MSDQSFTDLLTQTATILSRTYNSGDIDRFGVPTETIAETEASEPCLIQNLGQTIEFSVKGKSELATYLGFFKVTANISLDSIVIFNNVKYQVINIDDAAGQNHHYEVYLKKMENN
ncbi:hypothetical protein LCGC14_0306100 [marine sediment metagenome]|uniref:Phage head-tail adaptor n=1 Tax=marine sediment metagenome TaxID=412755 RepID=A0A0F9WAQ0_9ZZZZ